MPQNDQIFESTFELYLNFLWKSQSRLLILAFYSTISSFSADFLLTFIHFLCRLQKSFLAILIVLRPKFNNLKVNVMNKMNRSSSSRRNKTLLNDESSSWIGNYPLPPRQTNLSNSYLESNKENNSLFQSISERNFPVQTKERLNSEFDSNDINLQFY